ncbi:MAG: hypothetical protein ABW000_15945 [Actinoplanes sp.]
MAAPDGELLWGSGVLPGRTADITAARRIKIAEKVLAFLGLLADLASSRVLTFVLSTPPDLQERGRDTRNLRRAGPG